MTKKNLKSISLTSNKKLAQSKRHQSREVPGSILSEGFFLLKQFYPMSCQHCQICALPKHSSKKP